MSHSLRPEDIAGLFAPDDPATEAYRSEPFTDELLASVEAELGFELPDAYVWLMRQQNGGYLERTCHRTATPTSWAPDHVAATGIYGIGRTQPYSLCGELGSRFWCTEWEYPAIGVYFADCPSGGHDMLCLDYTACGPRGEPRVVHVDQDMDFHVTLVAETFEDFIRGLQPEEAFPDE
jgi:hypothetical protein